MDINGSRRGEGRQDRKVKKVPKVRTYRVMNA